MRVDKSWQVVAPDEKNPLKDTREANVEFVIKDEEGMILIAVHSFPSESLAQRIPPRAQVQRWQRQYEEVQEESVHMLPVAHGGFAGVFFTVTGRSAKFGEKESTLLAWAMQLDEEHYQALTYAEASSDELEKNEQKRSDYTIKVIGNREVIEKYRAAIKAFARSFELIDVIPERR